MTGRALKDPAKKNNNQFKVDEFVKSHKLDGTIKSSRCKARESLGMRRTYRYVGMTKDEAQRSRWTFYEAVKVRVWAID
jgi:hypothetical protein